MRECDFEVRRKHLAGLTDSELEERFWGLTGEIMEPLLKIAKQNTTPSIERSVLLRMGFNSFETKELVDKCIEHKLLRKGAGHLVWRLSSIKGISVRSAGELLLQDREWETVKSYLESGEEYAPATR